MLLNGFYLGSPTAYLRIGLGLVAGTVFVVEPIRYWLIELLYFGSLRYLALNLLSQRLAKRIRLAQYLFDFWIKCDSLPDVGLGIETLVLEGDDFFLRLP